MSDCANKYEANNQLRVQFEDIYSEEDADAIMKSGVYLPTSLLPKLKGNKFYHHEVIDFSLEDVSFGLVGKIISINDTTAQPLFVVSRENSEVLIPMIDDFIQKVDRKNKKVIVDTPQGLIEMNLE